MDKVTIELSPEQALVLFEWFRQREKDEPEEVTAEQVVLWAIDAQLERTLVTPFENDYLNQLEQARRRVLEGAGQGIEPQNGVS